MKPAEQKREIGDDDKRGLQKKQTTTNKKKKKTCIADEEDAASVAEDPSISVNCFALKLFASTS